MDKRKNMQQDKLSRRKFVAGTAGATVGAMIVPRHVLGGPGFQAPSDRLNIAVVGTGNQGATDMAELVVAGENVAAVADVDFAYVDRSVKERMKNKDGSPNESFIKLQEAYAKAPRYADFRVMLEREKGIDGIVVATPDHLHATVAKTAMELGKHVYVEKPLTYTIHEARVLRETAARTKRVTQMGNMGHSSEEARLINEWVQAGVIGPVHEVHVWTNRPVNYWPQGVPRPVRANAAPDASGGGYGNDWTQKRVNKETAIAMAAGFVQPPKTLNWDLFLGPGPQIEYHPVYHPFNWRGWVDWGTGALGDMAAHLIDHPYWALGLTYPTSVEATGTAFGLDEKGKPASYPLATKVVYQYPERGSQPPVTLTWVDGGLMGMRPKQLPDNVPLQKGGGVIFFGEKGVLVHETYGKNPRLYPESLMEAAKQVPKRYERVITNDKGDALHRVNWANAIKGKGQASTPFDYAAPLTENMLLGIVALRAGYGNIIRYDGAAGRVTNNEEANQFLQREYRKGWTL